jgi:hypothetical protein
MAYYIFQKSLRSLQEFRKNPHVKIPPKSPSTNFQSLGKFKNPIFIRKRIFLHFRPIRPSSQPAYSASRSTPPPGLHFPRPAYRPTPPSSALSRRRVKPPWLQQTPPRPPLSMADCYPSLIPAIIEIYNHYFLPPFNPHRRHLRIPRPGARPPRPL